MSELAESEGISQLKSPSDEFFDAVDGVDVAKDDNDDFFKKIDMACSENELVGNPENVSKPVENGKSLELNVELNESFENQTGSDMDHDKLENDLLKDLDDDRNEDLESIEKDIEKEVEDLLESVLEGDEKHDEKVNSVEKEVDDLLESVMEDAEPPKESAEVVDDKLIADGLLESALGDGENVNSEKKEADDLLESTMTDAEPPKESAEVVDDKLIADDLLESALGDEEGESKGSEAAPGADQMETEAATDETKDSEIEKLLEEAEKVISEAPSMNNEADVEMPVEPPKADEESLGGAEVEKSEEKSETTAEDKPSSDGPISFEEPVISEEPVASNEPMTSEEPKTSEEGAEAPPMTVEDPEKLDSKPEESSENQPASDPSPEEGSTSSGEKEDALLVACSSPKRQASRDEQEIASSETSSTAGDTPEESNDEKLADDAPKADDAQPESMEVDVDESTKASEEESKVNDVEMVGEGEDSEDRHLCMVVEDSAPPKPQVSLKLKFLRKFASVTGKLSRPELEELLIQKITESLRFCSDNSELRARLEKQETINESLKKRLENVKKQYQDLEMIHNRVKKDLRERPDAPITPVKITRAVGLQVYQPSAARTRPNIPVPAPPPVQNHQVKITNKRPMEADPSVNGESSSSDNAKRKKTLKITPLRPTLSEKDRVNIDMQQAKDEQKLRTNVSKVIPTIPQGLTMTPVQQVNGTTAASRPSPSTSQAASTSQSIDLTDDEDAASTSLKAAPQAFQQPPALVAIRAANGGTPQRTTPAYIIKTPATIVPQQNASRLPQFRPNPEISRTIQPAKSSAHPAPLPKCPPQYTKPGLKKVPPRPTIKINNVHNGIIVSWTVDGLDADHAEIHSYQIYAYEETSSIPSTDNWKHVGDVKALLLPMAVTLTQFQEGQKYFFAVRAVDIHKRLGSFSAPKTWADK